MIVKYALDQGYDLKKYELLKKEIEEKANNILEAIKNGSYAIGSGVYYPVDEIIRPDDKYKYLLIYQLKKMMVEFYDNSTLFRY